MPLCVSGGSASRALDDQHKGPPEWERAELSHKHGDSCFSFATDSILDNLAELFAPRMSARSKDGFSSLPQAQYREVNLVTTRNIPSPTAPPGISSKAAHLLSSKISSSVDPPMP